MSVAFVLLAFWSNLCHVSGSSCFPYDPAPKEDLAQLAVAVNELAVALHKRLSTNSSENLIFSPLGIAVAFEMIFYGARGDTAEELGLILGHKKAAMSDQLVQATFHRFLCGIQIAKNSSSGDISETRNTRTRPSPNDRHGNEGLTVTSSVLVDEQNALLPEYKNTVEHLYQAPVQNVDFAGDSRVVLEQMNEWAKEMTNGKILQLDNDVDSDTVMVLLNAVHFKGSWERSFTDVIFPNPSFKNYGSESQTIHIPMIHMADGATFKYGSGADYEALELPYKGDNFSMIVILPRRQDGLADFEKSLTSEKLADIQHGMRDTASVFPTLPRFKIKYSRELTQDFKALGATKAFDDRSADFTGMTFSGNVYVSKADHVATIEVNKDGSEAEFANSASSSEESDDTTPPTRFLVDRPFLLAILDMNSGMIVMMGRVIHLEEAFEEE